MERREGVSNIMGQKATCPLCGGYSSDIQRAINEGRGCPDCEAPYEILRKYENLQEDIAKLQETRFNKESIKVIEEIKKENIVLKGALEQALKYLCSESIVPSLMKAIQVLKRYNFEQPLNLLPNTYFDVLNVPARVFIGLFKDQKISSQQLMDILREERDYEECMELLERYGIDRNSIRGSFTL